jgi:6-phospho-beta-glucosidase
MSEKLVILGGSSPFTCGLITAIQCAAQLTPRSLWLYGRNAAHLDLISRFARAQLSAAGWTVHATTNCAEALADADCVIHQIRYGDMSGRQSDEELARSHGIPGDETLGPGALCAAIRMVPALHQLREMILKYCPRAWILNLTNPLSISTAILAGDGKVNCIGLCELPQYTMREACKILGLNAEKVHWSYRGLNHRGFIHELSHDGTDDLAGLPEVLGDRSIGGIAAGQIAELRALPLKYFRCLSGGEISSPGRVRFLSQLQETIFRELRDTVETSPPSLNSRSMEWYPGAVVPMLAAIDAADRRAMVVNLLREDGIVWEMQAQIVSGHCRPLPSPALPDPAQRWTDIFAEHERRALAAALDPSEDRIEAALAADPLVPAGKNEKVPALLRDVCLARPMGYQLA